MKLHGRWCGLSSNEQICKNCDNGEAECGAFLLHYTGMVEERMEIKGLMKETVGRWQEIECKEKVVWVVGKACDSGIVQKEVERLYGRRSA